MVSVSAEPLCGAIDVARGGEAGAAAEWRLLARLEKTAIGARGADGVTTVRRREPAGCLLYGPYWQLSAGIYRLTFRCRSGVARIPSAPVLGVEAIAMNRVQLAWLDLTAGELQSETGALHFTVPAALGLGAGDEARLEFRFFHMGNADLTIAAVDLHRVDARDAPAAPARVWRMLGRLEKAAIGKRSGEGVSVRRTERAGCLLDGGRPLLQLPSGHYRLGFRCDAGTPRMASEPVLGVEIVAWRRWRDPGWQGWGSLLGRAPRGGVQQAWADFTAPELSSGSGSLEFAVPAELSLEGGQEVQFGFRFIHMANADLTVDAVELRQVADSAIAAPPRAWRLLGRLAKGRIGAREADCLAVRQAEPAGALLCGGRPDLRLPRGRYRLSLCCQAGAPRTASDPVLGVEVLARARLRGSLLPLRSRLLQARRDFMAEALRAGSVSVDFEVPAELSLEGGESASFEFRILHFGNADLTIDAVTLHEQASGNPAPALVSPGKTDIVIVGNCQAQTVYEALLRTGELNARLNPKYHFVGLQKDLHERGRSELEKCEVVLVQDIRDWENYPLRPYVREDLRIIRFPLLHFASLWPFDHYNGPGDKEAYQREWPNLTFLYQDGLLARLRKEIPDREQRLQAYRALSIPGVINYVRLHDFEKRRLLAMDQQFGLAIGQYILENFRKRRLFYTTNHPNGQIIAMLMQYLLRQLGIDQVYRPNASLDHLKRLQVPVHPKVAQALGVKWANEATKYLYAGEQITWETYIRRYIEHYG